MPCDPTISVAFETSGRTGQIALGRGDTLLEACHLPQKKRHNLELVPALDALCREHGLTAGDLDELYISLGPGSFTGLRVAVATAQMLAMTNPKLKLVGVPTIEVLALQHKDACEHIAVCLNIKRGTMFAGVYQDGRAVVAPALRTADDLLTQAPRPLAVVAEVDCGIEPGDGVTLLLPEAAVADASITWAVGRALAGQGQYTAPPELQPLYIRQPEAVTIWDEQGKA